MEYLKNEINLRVWLEELGFNGLWNPQNVLLNTRTKPHPSNCSYIWFQRQILQSRALEKMHNTKCEVKLKNQRSDLNPLQFFFESYKFGKFDIKDAESRGGTWVCVFASWKMLLWQGCGKDKAFHNHGFFLIFSFFFMSVQSETPFWVSFWL